MSFFGNSFICLFFLFYAVHGISEFAFSPPPHHLCFRSFSLSSSCVFFSRDRFLTFPWHIRSIACTHASFCSVGKNFKHEIFKLSRNNNTDCALFPVQFCSVQCNLCPFVHFRSLEPVENVSVKQFIFVFVYYFLSFSSFANFILIVPRLF